MQSWKWSFVQKTELNRVSLKVYCERFWRCHRGHCGSHLAVVEWCSREVHPWRVQDHHAIPNGTLTSVRYWDENASQWSPDLVLGWFKTMSGLIWQDCWQFLDDKGIDATFWPSGLLDLNLIEHLWLKGNASDATCYHHKLSFKSSPIPWSRSRTRCPRTSPSFPDLVSTNRINHLL